MFRKNPTFHTRHVYGAGPEEYTIVTYQEVSIWEEFLAMFSNKDNWGYIIRKGDKYLFVRTEHELHDILEWNEKVYDATMFDTYNRAMEFEKRAKTLDNKAVCIIIIKPTTKDSK